MQMPNLGGLVQMGKTLVMANRPELLFGASITATLAAVGLAAKGGYDARGIIDENILKQEIDTSVLTARQKANLTWHCYVPSAVTTITALGSTTGLHIVHVKEKKALAQGALVAIDEVKKAAREFEKENVGVLEDKEKEKILNARAGKGGGEVQIMDSDGLVEDLVLVRDPVSGRDIWSNRARIEEAIVEIGNNINASDEASLNNFYEQAGYGRIPMGETLGWSGVIPSILWTDPNGQPISGVRDDGRPFRGFRFLPEPEKGFDDSRRA